MSQVSNESTNPQDREPAIGYQGQVYVSLLDGNLMVKVGERILFDLTEKDGRDLIEVLTDTLARDAARKAESLTRDDYRQVTGAISDED